MANVLLVEYDNESHLPLFPMNLFYLLGALKKQGHTVGIWFQNIHHEQDSRLTEILDQGFFDVVGIGAVAGYYPYRKLKSLSKVINSHKRRKKILYVLGGHGPAGAPEFFLKKMGCDSVVVGDGENVFCDLIENGKRGVIEADSASEDYPDLSCYECFPMNVYRLNRCPTSKRTDFTLPILSSRGCKWNCSFCYRMRKGFHERETAAIMEEIRFLYKNYRINHFDFEDELLMGSEKRTAEVCEAIANIPYKIKWDCNGRLNFAKKDLLKLMKKSGCEYVNYGIESLNQKILNDMGKGITVDMIYEGIRNTLDVGLSPGLNLLWGFPDNTIGDLKNEVAFLMEFDPGDELRTIRPVTPYPGCRLFNEAVEKGLVKDAEDFYENKHKNSDLISVNFMDIPEKEAHRQLFLANRELVTNYIKKRKSAQLSSAEALYLKGETNFRGFRPV